MWPGGDHRRILRSRDYSGTRGVGAGVPPAKAPAQAKGQSEGGGLSESLRGRMR